MHTDFVVSQGERDINIFSLLDISPPPLGPSLRDSRLRKNTKGLCTWVEGWIIVYLFFFTLLIHCIGGGALYFELIILILLR